MALPAYAFDRDVKGGLDAAERASRDEIQALQMERLSWSLRHAYDNVPFYRAQFDAAGIHPSDLKSLSDLSKFPFTVKTDLRDHYPFGLFAVPREKLARIHGSSGTTGKPIVVGYTQADIDMWADVMARSIRAAGVRPGQMVHVAYGYGLFTGGLGAHYGAERLGCTVVPMSGGMTERQVQLIHDFKPDAIMVTPSYMLALMDGFLKAGIDPRTTSLKYGHLRAPSPGPMPCARRSSRPFALDATDIYGLSEVIGPRRRPGMRGDQGRAAHLGRPLLSGGDRSHHRRGAARWREGRAGLHLAHQGSLSPSSATAPATSPAFCRAPRGRACGAWRR